MDKLPESTNVAVIQAIPADILAHVTRIGRVEWGQTPACDAPGHGAHVAESVRLTAARFGQTGDQHMHGLWLEGTQTVLCHTGTSPNAPATTQALVGMWNWLVDLATCSDVAQEVETRATSGISDALPADVRRLVIAARAFIDPETVALPFMEEHAELFAAAEAFADRVPWLDQPEDVEDAA